MTKEEQYRFNVLRQQGYSFSDAVEKARKEQQQLQKLFSEYPQLTEASRNERRNHYRN